MPKRTQLFQSLRKPRAEQVQRIAYKYRDHFILPDGPQQEKRDQQYRKLSQKEEEEGHAAQSRLEALMENYDAVHEVRATGIHEACKEN